MRNMRILHRLRDFIAQIGAEPFDSDDLRLQKTLLVFVALFPSAAGIVWGFIYASFGARFMGRACMRSRPCDRS